MCGCVEGVFPVEPTLAPTQLYDGKQGDWNRFHRVQSTGFDSHFLEGWGSVLSISEWVEVPGFELRSIDLPASEKMTPRNLALGVPSHIN